MFCDLDSVRITSLAASARLWEWVNPRALLDGSRAPAKGGDEGVASMCGR